MKFALCILVILGCASGQFGPVGIKHILRAHNDLRSDIAMGIYDGYGAFKQPKPPATNMRKVGPRSSQVWEEEFEIYG
ncbi:Protein CBG01195 [Caenorhabditis briggsae]|uniref:Protein CBG01195 n=1 Tax=Caenorhabditis briggsae TaxID=6238 RepID=A8WPT4_CAEBR|nr:Protein CBG01195 [Caenorhabditis briggsae]CAP22491.1 Protein CBG01195 [Caenorhabditis briggsae]